MRARIRGGALAALVLAVGAAAACGYDPNPESGALQCGPSNSCPDNYSCMSGRCFRNCEGGSGPAVNKFIGHWVSDPTLAKRVRVCNDGTNETLAWDDYLDIADGACGTLDTNYYCDWSMDVAAGGNATTIHPGAKCSQPDMNDPTIMYTWHGETLTLTTTNGTSGTLEMSLPYEYVTATGSGSCMMHFTGPMTKI